MDWLLNTSKSHKTDNPGMMWRRNTLDHHTFSYGGQAGQPQISTPIENPVFFLLLNFRLFVCTYMYRKKNRKTTPIWVFYRSMADACPGCLSEMRATSKMPFSTRGQPLFLGRAYSPRSAKHLSKFMPSVITNRQCLFPVSPTSPALYALSGANMPG